MQRLPRCQVAVRLVHVLVHNKKGKLLVAQRVREPTPVLCVTPVGTGSDWHVDHARLAYHEQAREQRELR